MQKNVKLSKDEINTMAIAFMESTEKSMRDSLFTTLFNALYPEMVNVLTNKYKNILPEDVEDCVADVFAKVCAPGFAMNYRAEGDNFKAYFYAVAENGLKNFVKKNARVSFTDSEDYHQGLTVDSAEVELLKSVCKSDLQYEIISNLTPSLREVYEYICAHPACRLNTMAEELGLKEGTLRKRFKALVDTISENFRVEEYEDYEPDV